jgi:hypothetical protein
MPQRTNETSDQANCSAVVTGHCASACADTLTLTHPPAASRQRQHGSYDNQQPATSQPGAARTLQIGPGAGPQAGFSAPRYVLSVIKYQGTRDFRKKKWVRGLPAPPGGSPVLGPGFLSAGAEGLPSTRNWPFRWPLSRTSPPQVIPKAM